MVSSSSFFFLSYLFFITHLSSQLSSLSKTCTLLSSKEYHCPLNEDRLLHLDLWGLLSPGNVSSLDILVCVLVIELHIALLVIGEFFFIYTEDKTLTPPE